MVCRRVSLINKMRFLVLLFLCVLAASLVSANPVDSKGLSMPGVKGLPARKHQETPNRDLKKGEYICKGEICRLEPGKPPADCVDCQYPIKLFRNN